MTDVVRLSIWCQDRVGLVSAIAARLFDLGINLGDGTFATLGEGAEFTALCDLPSGLESATLRGELGRLPELAEATIHVSPFGLRPYQQDAARMTHEITCIGPDQPGLLARLSEALVTSGANIASLVATRLEGSVELYRMILTVGIPPSRTETCLATLSNTAQQLGQTLTWTNAVADTDPAVSGGR